MDWCSLFCCPLRYFFDSCVKVLWPKLLFFAAETAVDEAEETDEHYNPQVKAYRSHARQALEQERLQVAADKAAAAAAAPAQDDTPDMLPSQSQPEHLVTTEEDNRHQFFTSDVYTPSAGQRMVPNSILDCTQVEDFV